MKITEKVSYLKGLIDGLGIDESTKEGKVFKAILDVLNDMAFSVEDLEDEHDELVELVDTIDEDLGSLEEDYYDLDEDDDDDDDDDESDFDDELYEVTCPNCGDTVCIDAEMLKDGEIDCPNCGQKLEFDFDLEDCDCEECSHSEEDK